MTFKEFSHAVKQDARLTNLINRYSDCTDSITDDELQEMVDRSAAIFDDDDPFDCSDESPVDLYGPWWE